MVRPLDPRYASQWHFSLMGNIERIWDEYTGKGVTVGVYDTGVQYTHADLNDNYDASLHFRQGGITYNPTPIQLTGTNHDGHGTSVAGLIAAEKNGIGGVGVAWDATITAVNMLSDSRLQDDDMFASVIEHAAKFDIVSNSWAYTPYFEDFQNLANPDSAHNRFVEAFDDVTTSGRDGLGTVIVLAAGNEGLNASGDGLNTSRFVVSVAALDSKGATQSYSNWGSNILVSAGAASVTTDLMGRNGYDTRTGTTGDYTSGFGGTSAATPVVSGVVALMLEANPNLGWRDVKEILATSAKLTGAVATGITGQEKGNQSFQSINTGSQRSGDTWNDGGRFHSDANGFGRVDAFAAVRLAEVWGLTHSAAQTSANELQYSFSETSAQSLTSNSAGNLRQLNDSFMISGAMSIEYISVTLDFAYGSSFQSDKNLTIWLESPTDTRIDLFSGNPTGNVYDLGLTGGINWTFGSMVALGLDTKGTWTLHISDTGQKSSGYSAVLNSFTVDFYGAAKDLNDTHYITQDFLLAHKKDAGDLRDKVISDTNGGTDWLHMAMLSGNVVASLVGGSSFSVNKVTWGKLASNASIENMVTGDGNDKLTGNSGANEIHAMRGNDTVSGGGGNDRLYGGTGADSLKGEDGADWLYAGTGNDVADGGAGQDQILGGDGADKLYGGADADTLTGDAGNDIIDGGLGNDAVFGGAGNDVISEASGGGNDVVRAGTGRDKVNLGAGDDRFDDESEVGLAGSDTVFGGTGNDTLLGAGGNDSLTGDAGNDLISGGVGNDTLAGSAGVDVIEGGAGADLLSGGSDADNFVFRNGSGADRVTDFADNIDTLLFDDALWGNAVLSVTQVVTSFAKVIGGNIVFDFGDGDVVTVTGPKTLAALYDDITLI